MAAMNKKLNEQGIERNCYTCKNYSLNQYSLGRSCHKEDFKNIQKNFHDCCEDYVLDKEVKERFELARQVKEIVIPNLPYEVALLEKIADTWENWGREKTAGLYAELDKALKKGDYYSISQYLMVPLFHLEFDLAKDWLSTNGYKAFAERIAFIQKYFYQRLSKAEENAEKAYRKKRMFKRKNLDKALFDIDFFLAGPMLSIIKYLREIVVALKSKLVRPVLAKLPEKPARIQSASKKTKTPKTEKKFQLWKNPGDACFIIDDNRIKFHYKDEIKDLHLKNDSHTHRLMFLLQGGSLQSDDIKKELLTNAKKTRPYDVVRNANKVLNEKIAKAGFVGIPSNVEFIKYDKKFDSYSLFLKIHTKEDFDTLQIQRDD